VNGGDHVSSVSRRRFLVVGGSAAAAAAGALVVGFRLRESRLGASSGSGGQAAAAPRPNPLDAWVRVAADGTIALLVAKSEMGQGVFTSLPMILAEELDVDWETVQVEQAPTRARVYNHMTGGSSSVRTSWLPLRQAAAAAREMLVRAAATAWNVDPATCRAERGFVIHDGRNALEERDARASRGGDDERVADGRAAAPRGAGTRRAAYAELVAAAAKLPVPDFATVPLKGANTFCLLGTSPIRRDVPSKIDGSARFGLDVRVPGQLFAVIARCPTVGGSVRRFDAAKATQTPGVRHVFEIPALPTDRIFATGGVAIVADTTWAAIQGRDALQIEWDHGPHTAESSAALRAQFETLIAKEGDIIVRNDGDARAALAGAGAATTRIVDAVYDLPFQAHAPMEPMNCTVHVRDGEAEAWVPTQGPHWAQEIIALLTKIPLEKVTVHTTMMGGSFGRRFSADWVAEATQISQRVKAPIQIVWTREDDIMHDFYRPASLHKLTAALDSASGMPVALRYRMTSTSLQSLWDASPKRRVERSETHGAADAPYAIPSFRLEYTPAKTAVPVQWWRSVEHSVTCFAVECFIDEVAHAGGIDPLELRLRLLADARPFTLPWEQETPSKFKAERLRGVLRAAAGRVGWGKQLPAGRGLGLACVYAFETYVAEIAEVSIEHGEPRVHRVVCAVDCGQVVHPDGVAAQMQGGIIYGLSATLRGAITIDKGQAQQRNFDAFQVIRIQDAPVVDVHIMPSTEAPSGTGEPGLPPIAPAVANALFKLTGRRLRRLPIRSDDLA
jgi:isoquinoline 1-oxidoreductase beta subunit